MWRVSSEIPNPEDEYDPVATAQVISAITMDKAAVKADKVKKFRQLTAQRNRAIHKHYVKKEEPVIPVKHSTEPTPYQEYVKQVSLLLLLYRK